MVTKLTLLHLNNSPARVTQLAMEQSAELRQLSRLQNVFIESFTVAVVAVDEIFRSNGNGTQGTDNVAFKKVSEIFNQLQVVRLVGSKYLKSSKKPYNKSTPKIAKDNADLDMERALEMTQVINDELKCRLLKQCNLKSKGKNYRAGSVKRI